jgi:hypothetical protein
VKPYGFIVCRRSIDAEHPPFIVATIAKLKVES